jgi:hypothetical protein
MLTNFSEAFVSEKQHPFAGIPPAKYSVRNANWSPCDKRRLALAELEAFPRALLAVLLALAHA